MIMAMVSLTACASCTTDNDEPKKEEPGTENPGPSTGSEGIAGLGINKDNNMDYANFPPFRREKRTSSDNTPQQRLRYADCRSWHLQSDR